MDGRRRRTRVATTAGVVAGTLAGVGLAVLADPGTAQQPDAGPGPWIEATHLPPLLTAPEEPVELRYDAFCFAEQDVEEPCDVQVDVLVRRSESGAFRPVPVTEEPGAASGRFVAMVPSALARSPRGFSYYAVLRDTRTGVTTTLPAGGEAAPQRSVALEKTVEISLAAHRFGAVRRASSRVLSAPWGSQAGAVGLEPGHLGTPAGGSSFDVTADGTVHVLDEANRRVLRWRPGASHPEELSVDVNGTIADLAVDSSGTTYVLETTAPAGEPAVARAFDSRGRPLGAARLVERSSQIRTDHRGGALVLQQPSGQWTAAFEANQPASGARQKSTGRPGRALATGDELVVARVGDEIRVALVTDHGVRRSWRVTSASSLAEVQLADVVGRSIVIVVRVYSEARDEFLTLVLGEQGLEHSFSVESSDWAETAPLSRFRVAGRRLYQLGSSPEGLFVDRFDLEVER